MNIYAVIHTLLLMIAFRFQALFSAKYDLEKIVHFKDITNPYN